MSKGKKQPAAESRDYTARCRHHLTPKSRGGDHSPENLLLLKIDRHFYWHKLFGRRTLEEVIQLLLRVHRVKGRCLYAQMGLHCRSAACLASRPNGNGRAGKENNEQPLSYRNGKGNGNRDHNLLRHRAGKLSLLPRQQGRKGKQ